MSRLSTSTRRRVARLTAFAVVVGSLGLAAGAASPVSAKGSSSIQYTLRFKNGVVINGTASENDTFVAGAGGTSATNPTGMIVHVSCSDPFTGGWGVKQGPKQGVDTAWQLDSYYINKGDKTCGTPTPPAPPKEPKIDIEKYVNNDDADTAPGPTLTVGNQYKFTFKVTNTGEVPLDTINVTDSVYGDIPCDDNTPLAVGASRWCTEKPFTAVATNTMTPPYHYNLAKVVGTAKIETPSTPPPTGDSKSISYQLVFMNGKTITGTATENDTFVAGAGGTSATNPTGMIVHVSCSDPFTGGWGVKQGPKQGVDTAWQLKSFYIVKGSKTCGTPGPTVETREVHDEDPAHYNAKRTPPPPPGDYPEIYMKLYIDGNDANTAPGPTFPAGSSQKLTYKVTNTGPVTLTNVWVNDMTRGQITCPKTTLTAGESMWCTPRYKYVSQGDNFHRAKATGTFNGDEYFDRDPVNFVGAY